MILVYKSALAIAYACETGDCLHHLTQSTSPEGDTKAGTCATTVGLPKNGGAFSYTCSSRLGIVRSVNRVIG